MDAFSLFTKFLREMFLGIMYAVAAVALLVATPLIFAVRLAGRALGGAKGGGHDCLYGR